MHTKALLITGSTCLIYKATVTSSDEMPPKEYVGLSATEFKLRYANHKQSFVNRQKRDATSLSQYVWHLKDQNLPVNISWKILAKCKPYVCGSKSCDICTTEKFEILKMDPKTALNKRTEIVGKCRHRAKYKLKNA